MDIKGQVKEDTETGQKRRTFITWAGSYNQLQKYLRQCTVFWLKWPVNHLVLLTPLHPLSKLPAIKDHAQNLEEQLWMGGRREVSISPHRPVTSSDLKQERLCFCESVSTFLQLVVALHVLLCKDVNFSYLASTETPAFSSSVLMF